jgi:hypothetical protein
MEQRHGWQWGRVRSRRAAAVGVAGVVVLALVGVFALRGSPGASTGADGAALTTGGPAATAAADGLTLSLRLSPGPYFLSELVAARMMLANGSDVAYQFQGVPETNDCDQAIGVLLAGGQEPRYTLPTQGFVSCPEISSTLEPGETWTVDQLLPLTASGDVSLTAQARFIVSGTDAHGTAFETGSDGPFAGRWPTLHLAVAPNVPAGRGISLRPINLLSIHRVSIAAPEGARAPVRHRGCDLPRRRVGDDGGTCSHLAVGERRYAGRARLPRQRRGMELFGRRPWLRHRVGAVSGAGVSEGRLSSPPTPLLARRGEWCYGRRALFL